MPIGHSDVRDIGSGDIVATRSFFLVTLANPVLLHLDVYCFMSYSVYESIVHIKWKAVF